MKNIPDKSIRGEKGQVLILAVILLLLGVLLIVPLLNFMATGIITGRVFEGKMNEVYAADAGVEDALHKILTPDLFPEVADLDDGDSTTYQLPDVNGYPVDVTVTKLSLVHGLLGEDEYKTDQPHEDWIGFEVPPGERVTGTDEGGDYVEYTCHVTFSYEGAGNRSVTTVGAFFSPPLVDEDLVVGPYGYLGTETGVLHFNDLKVGSPTTKLVAGGFGFVWRWEKNMGPLFDKNNRDGAFSFKFKVYKPTWEVELYFVWASFKEQDISYAASADFYKWLIEATAGDTEVRSGIIERDGELSIMSWEINPPA